MTSKANKHQNITQIKHIKQYEYSSKTRQKKKKKNTSTTKDWMRNWISSFSCVESGRNPRLGTDLAA